MTKHSIYGLTIAALIGLANAAIASEDAKKSASMLAKWRCAAFAEIKGDSAEQARLYLSGLEDGKSFAHAAIDGKISSEEASKYVPLMIAMRVGGQSVDFMLGRFFEAIMDDAVGLVDTPNTTDGLPLSGEARKMSAETRFDEANCQLLK